MATKTEAAPATVDTAPPVVAAKAKMMALQAERRRVADALAKPDESAAELAKRLLENPDAGPDPKAADKPALRARAEALGIAIGEAEKAWTDARAAAGRAIAAEGAPALADARQGIADALGELQSALNGHTELLAGWTRRGVRAPILPQALANLPGLNAALAGLAQAASVKGN